MRILALEPYNGGSHRAFLDGWSDRSRHAWTILGLPAYKWKWRMRHAAITLADQVGELVARGQGWDRVFCSDMLNLAEFRGLAPPSVRDLPTVVYFHENQLTYPERDARERDHHFAFTNITTALAATEVWFNTAFHRDEFIGALGPFLARMPDYQPMDIVDRIRGKSRVYPPGIDQFPPRGGRASGPMRVLWAARWEHDKNPDAFFAALRRLRSQGAAFSVSVIGEQFADSPAVFQQARVEFADCIDHWGYLEAREDYEAALAGADVFVSTASHEFFGIAAVEAVAAGAYPLLPNRLAYPEVLSDVPGNGAFFYEPDEALADRLAALADQVEKGHLWPDGLRQCVEDCIARFCWEKRASAMDAAIAGLPPRANGSTSD
ncbi:MAG: DUF3524 domain-containing protein [Planctomycetota bacterium]